MKLTPVLIVDNIEKCLPFWVDRVGFQKVAEVPDEGRLGFVMLVNDGAELMLQTRESVRKDAPETLPAEGAPAAGLFVVVDSLDEIMARLQGVETLVAERTTFYGMREYGVRDPAGNVVVFAQPLQARD